MNKIVTLAAALLMTSTAFAQNAPANWIEIDDDAVQVPGLNVSVDELEDMDVFTERGESIGEVDEVLGTEAGVVSAVAIEIDEGLFDDKTIILEISELSVAEGRLITQLTQEQIEAMPDYND
ncbi:PRC-barrel domain-containing protein [Devosia submarina]|uniref:PRC-barrel domain-containing protein n=1 Tax=Devosia submarina TaxID=1173082 RepID=UPI000D34DE81|nr:PRC-barrel domain-containing protein [Devosia submarina]